MTLQFPSDPINGAVSGDYTYDATKGAWRKNAALPVSVTHSDVAPSNPREGDQWWKSDEGTLFTYYNDGNSSQWVESTNVVANVEPNPIPAGAMMAWGSDTIPSNWLLCDGSAVSRSTYASLFAAVGTQYGSGDGTTTFNLPNIKGRTIVGKDASQTEFDVLGETGGAKTHTLTISEMPSHTHVQNSHNHTQNAHTHTQDSHNHTQNAHNHSAAYANNVGGNLNAFSLGSVTAQGAAVNSTTATNQATTATNQSTTATNQATTATNQNTGGGEAHNNLQPYIVLNYIIKFSAGETPGDSELTTRVGAAELDIDTIQSVGYRLVQTLYLTSNTTFTKATYPWLRAVKVRLVGGGGGGGSTVAPASGTNASGNGGGGGCYAERFITDISGMSSSVTVTVGAGGGGGSAATNNAAAGNTSSFGSFCSGNGGSPGLLGSQVSSVSFTIPNDSFTSRGGTTGVGDLVIPGGQGGVGFMQGGNANAMGGAGGSSILAGSIATPGYPGSGGFARNGPIGQNYGGGGGGGSSLQSAGSTTGGAGAPGIVILELYA
jgi:microcystin-dependent protein